MRTPLRRRTIALSLLAVCVMMMNSCLPKEVVELKDIQNLAVVPGEGGKPVLQGDAVFFNPNKSRMKLKAIKVDVFVDEKKAAVADHDLDVIVKGQSEFTVPLKVQLQFEDIGLMDAIKSLFGGKTYHLHYVGSLRVNINGFPFRVPIDHREDFKLKF
jgi:LEA14-like dessication related protein